MKPQIPFEDADRSVIADICEPDGGAGQHWMEDAKGERFSPVFRNRGALMEWKVTRGLVGEGSKFFGSMLDAQKSQDATLREEMKFRHG